MSELSPVLEAAVLRQSEDTLRDLINAFGNVGLSAPQIAFMLRCLADELAPSPVIEAPRIIQ